MYAVAYQETIAAEVLKSNATLKYFNKAAESYSSNAAKGCKGIFAQFPIINK